METKDPLNLNQAPVVSADKDVNDPLGLNSQLPEKKKTIPSESSGGKSPSSAYVNPLNPLSYVSPDVFKDNKYSLEAMSAYAPEVKKDLTEKMGLRPNITDETPINEAVQVGGAQIPPEKLEEQAKEQAAKDWEAQRYPLMDDPTIIQPSTEEQKQATVSFKRSLMESQGPELPQIKRDFGAERRYFDNWGLLNSFESGALSGLSGTLNKIQGAIDVATDGFSEVADIMESSGIPIKSVISKLDENKNKFQQEKQGTLAPTMPTPAGKLIGTWGAKLDQASKEFAVDEGQSRFAKTVKDFSSMTGFFAEMAALELTGPAFLTSEAVLAQKLSTVLGKTVEPTVNLMLPAIMSTEGLADYHNNTLAGMPVDEKIASATKAGAQGFATGAIFTALGYNAGGIAKMLSTEYGGKYSPAAASVILNSLGFGAVSQTESELAGASREEAQEAGLAGVELGLLMGVENMSKSMAARAYGNFMAVPPEQMAKFDSSPKSIEEMRTRSIELREEAKTADPKRAAKMLESATILDIAADASAMRLKAIEQGDQMKKIINENPDITPAEKELYAKQIDAARASVDPKFEQANEISSQIKDLQNVVAENNGNTAMPAEAKAAKNAPIEKLIEERRKALTELYTPPKEAKPVEKPTEPVEKPVESVEKPAKPVEKPVEPVEKPVEPKPAQVIKPKTRADYEESLTTVSRLSPKEKESHMLIADLMSEQWARENKRKPEEWFAETFSTIQNDAAAVKRIAEKNKITTEEAQALLDKKTGGTDPNGMVEFDKQNKAIITIFEGENRTTRLHEDLGHPYMQRRINEAITGSGKGAEILADVIGAYNKENKSEVSAADVLKGSGEAYKNIHEYFTSGFEKWADGKYNGDSKIVKYFEQFRDWIIDTYEKLGGKITPNVQMRKLYEEMLGLREIKREPKPETWESRNKELTANLEDAKKRFAENPESAARQREVNSKGLLVEAHNRLKETSPDKIVTKDTSPVVSEAPEVLFKRTKEQREADDIERKRIETEMRPKLADLQRSLGLIVETGETFTKKKPLLINRALGSLVYLDQLWKEKGAKKMSEPMSRALGKAIGNRKAVLRNSVKLIESLAADIHLTDPERARKELFIGDKELAAKRAYDLYENVAKLLESPETPSFEKFKSLQPEEFKKKSKIEQKNLWVEHNRQIRESVNAEASLRRIHMVLDPEFYKEPLTREEWIKQMEDDGIKVKEKDQDWIDKKYHEMRASYVEMMDKNAHEITELKDLTPNEVDAYNVIRAGLDMLHDISFINGHIDGETYAAYKGKYTPRLYEKFESFKPEDFEEGSFLDEKIVADIFKRRKKVDAWKYDNIVQDPAYGLAKRYAQIMMNKAIVDYAKEIFNAVEVTKTGSVRKYIGVPEQPGYSKLGKVHGFPSDTWVRKDIAEHFKGVFYDRAQMQWWVDTLDRYASLGVRVGLKKMVTVYQPAVRIGNVMGNVMFAKMQGINPLRYGYNYVRMSVTDSRFGDGKWGDYKEIYDYLQQRAIVSKDVNLEEMRGKVRQLNSLLEKAEKTGFWDDVKKADKWATETYQEVDTHGKIAAFRSLIDLGLKPEQAAARVADGFQNLNRLGRAYKYGAKTPFVGPPFGSFMGDLTRILRTNIAHNPMASASTLAMLIGMGELFSTAGVVRAGSDEEKELIAQGKKGMTFYGFTQALKETESQRKVREGRSGFPKIPMPFTKDIPLAYKFGGDEYNLARFIFPLAIYAGPTTSGDFVKIMSKTLPLNLPAIFDFIDFRKHKIGEPQGWEKAARYASSNVVDPVFSPLAQAGSNIDFMGNFISDPTMGKWNESGLLSDKQKRKNRMVFFVKGYIPYGGFIDDIRRVSTSGPDYTLKNMFSHQGKDYYGRDRTMTQVILRFLGYNAQVWDDTRYNALADKKVKMYISEVGIRCRNLGTGFGSYEEVDNKPVFRPGQLDKALVQEIKQENIQELVKKELLIAGSFYKYEKDGEMKYFQAKNPTDWVEVTKEDLPFRSVTKKEYDEKRNEEIEKLEYAISELKKYFKENPELLTPKKIQEIIDDEQYKEEIKSRLGIKSEPQIN